MVDIFRDFFALVRHDLSKKIELHLADILVALRDEATSLPSELMDIIMAQFLDKNVVRMSHPSHLRCVRFHVSEVCDTARLGSSGAQHMVAEY